MDTMSVNVATARSTACVAGARESTSAFLDGLVHPIAAENADTRSATSVAAGAWQ